jgi:hypothetical protein
MSALGLNDKPLWKHGLPAGDMPALIVLLTLLHLLLIAFSLNRTG